MYSPNLGEATIYIQNKTTALLEKDLLLHGWGYRISMSLIFPKQRKHFQLERVKFQKLQSSLRGWKRW